MTTKYGLPLLGKMSGGIVYDCSTWSVWMVMLDGESYWYNSESGWDHLSSWSWFCRADTETHVKNGLVRLWVILWGSTV